MTQETYAQATIIKNKMRECEKLKEVLIAPNVKIHEAAAALAQYFMYHPEDIVGFLDEKLVALQLEFDELGKCPECAAKPEEREEPKDPQQPEDPDEGDGGEEGEEERKDPKPEGPPEESEGDGDENNEGGDGDEKTDEKEAGEGGGKNTTSLEGGPELS